MSSRFSTLISNYFTASNRGDSASVLSLFTQGAKVVDHGENRELRGLAEIKTWLDGTVASYNLTAEILKSTETENGQTCEVSVSGDFPGSPLQFTYSFQFDQDQICLLDIS